MLSDCVVVSDPIEKAIIGGAHWAIADAFGNSAVVAYLDGKLRHWDNEVGVLTNDPPYDWQVEHLNRYHLYRADHPYLILTLPMNLIVILG